MVDKTIAGVSRRQRKKNEDIRLDLNQMKRHTGGKDTEMQTTVIEACKADE